MRRSQTSVHMGHARPGSAFRIGPLTSDWMTRDAVPRMAFGQVGGAKFRGSFTRAAPRNDAGVWTVGTR